MDRLPSVLRPPTLSHLTTDGEQQDQKNPSTLVGTTYSAWMLDMMAHRP